MDFTETFAELADKLAGWGESLILMLPNVVAAVLVVIVAALAARLVQRLLLRTMTRVSSYTQVNSLIGRSGYVIVLLAGVFVALGVLELDKTVTSLLAGAGIIGLALAFAFQDIAANFMAGILLSVRRPFTVGQVVETNGFFGTVEEVNLRSTILDVPGGQRVIIPNKEVFENPITNFSRTGRRRVELACGVAYGDDLEKAAQVALAAIENVPGRNPQRDVRLFFTDFGDSSINFVVRFWVDFTNQADYLQARHDAIVQLKNAFDENDVTIPFPIRTLDFGVVGGVNLNEVLPQRYYTQQDGAESSDVASA